MICPHCSHENAEGRKYCRVCAKPLQPEPARAQPTAPRTPQASSLQPKLSKMAVASLILSFFSLLLPFGIAALVLGHMSRTRIAKSEGRLKGTEVAFAGLILGYIMAPIGALLCLGAIGSLFQFNQELSKHPDDRAALVAVLKNGGRYKKVAAETPEQHQRSTVEALSMIRDRQTEYLNSHPDEGYACRLEQIGEPLNSDNELGSRIARSHYYIGIERCGTANKLWYTVLATPKAGFFTSPSYCLDSTGAIYEYAPNQQHDLISRLVAVDPELCPQDGVRADE